MFNSEKLNQPRGTATVHSHPAAHGLTYKLSDTTQTAFTLTLGRQVRPRPTVAAKPQSPLSQRSSLSASLQSTYENFAETVRQEFIEGSAIHSDLFVANIQITSDTQTLPGYEVSYPIHEALNWSIARFGHQARETLYAAFLQNEDSSCWQAKLSRPILDRGKGKPRKYETPVKNGSRAYLPNIPSSIRALIAQRYNVDVPSTGSFWNWIAQNPQIPILYTEGGKKALSLLSLGYVAIALYGVNGGYRAKDALGNPCPAYLMQDVERFTVPDRPIFLAFDQDAKPETNRLVNIALSRFAGLLQKQGAIVSTVRWESEQGKGVDDLIVTAGANAFHSAGIV
ncbi:MAG: DUF3854 domain-containing protein [Phormidesmis sp. CAN_BIN44]|nr:DUF3854 domain-containing protein [Phormidesmis sp. CAN_BIN44]